MKLHKTIKLRLQHITQDTVLKKMGYQSKVGRKTLHDFLSKKNIYCWLKDGHYDLKYSSETFLFGLVKTLDIPPEEYQPEIEKAKDRITAISKMSEPTIFIDTNFKRKNEPIFALAWMSGKRYIRLNKEQLVNKTDKEVLEIIVTLIRKHYKSTKGILPLWGEISRYVYHHTNTQRYLFSPDGLVLPSEEIQEPQATLKIKNQLIMGG